MQRKLIINADDFALTRGVNSAIWECAAEGVLRSATIMPNAEAFEDAVGAARQRKDIGVGIHFVLTGLKPLCAPQTIPELVGPDGRLPSGPGSLLRGIAGGRNVRSEIRKELLAQAERVFDSGIVPTHFDSHKHVHMIPAVLDILIELAQRFSVKWIRDPFEAGGAWKFFSDMKVSDRTAFLKQYAAALVTSPAGSFFRSRIRASGIRTPDRFYGVAATGLLNEDVLRRICGLLRPGVNELMTHPGRVDADLVRCKTRLLLSREREKDLLVSERVRDLFERNKIVLCNFGEVI